MSKGINKVILIGHLGQEVELSALSNGDSVCTLNIATTDAWKDKNTGQRMEKTEWHRVVAFKRLAEVCGQFLRKGSKVYIEGGLRTRSWEKDGQKRYTTEIVCRDMQMLDARDKSSEKTAENPSRLNNNGSQQSYTSPNQQGSQQQQPSPDQFDDDIPF
jgi:single-strand DNA-binding protein